jgi:hypothetical protein
MKATSARAAAVTLAAIASLCACRAPEPPTEPSQDPAHGAVELPALAGWRAQLALDVAPTGVWCVKPFDVFPQYAEDELVALDDLGRCWVLVSYGGRWTPFSTGPEGSWLGAVTQADLDPRVEGAELYAGAESGRIWEIVGHRREGVIDARLAAQIDGRQVHAIAAGEFDPARAGRELLVFTEPAELWCLAPRRDGLDGFEAELVSALDGRIRDAVVMPREHASDAGGADVLLVASRAGWIGKLTALAPELEFERLHELRFGRGRVALPVPECARRHGSVAYSTAEDGTLWRHFSADGAAELAKEVIYVGPTGPRGIAAGRFHADPARESVAVFGYSGRVELVSRPASGSGPWEVETLFVDRAAGHWLSAAELDGRNATDELVASGYAGRVVLLARPPGFGAPEGAARPPR